MAEQVDFVPLSADGQWPPLQKQNVLYKLCVCDVIPCRGGHRPSAWDTEKLYLCEIKSLCPKTGEQCSPLQVSSPNFICENIVEQIFLCLCLRTANGRPFQTQKNFCENCIQKRCIHGDGPCLHLSFFGNVYSLLSATTGSFLAAIREGKRPATRVKSTLMSTRATPPTSGSSAPMVEMPDRC